MIQRTAKLVFSKLRFEVGKKFSPPRKDATVQETRKKHEDDQP